MRQLPERWCALTPLARCGYWLGAVLLLSVIGGYSLPWAGSVLRTDSTPRQWQTLRALQMQAEQYQQTLSVKVPFSPLDFQREGTHLARWQPAETGGEMVLETLWAQIPSLFARFAERNMQAAAFSIRPVDGRLRLTLQLEVIDGE
ncbi:DNA utilization protein HofO [Trabulsiella odontotermitis]|uniref:HofO family protein n=1 Tax=Trabulsiella odontotermitis TaxID=379893 RepID=UPI003AD474C3